MRLQMVLNAAARLIPGRRRFDHISPILISLNWLTVKSINIFYNFNLFLNLCKIKPHHISTYKPNRSLRSSNLGLLSGVFGSIAEVTESSLVLVLVYGTNHQLLLELRPLCLYLNAGLKNIFCQ